ncbi:DUF3846 domain-containing protein [Streptomyces sp. NPDC017940]|uniref:DUF3846 domain-containing protein n=1 Tax=Streptomyces sp. NPDC017940 TaxID=3365017 RepID=UPI0037A65B4B
MFNSSCPDALFALVIQPDGAFEIIEWPTSSRDHLRTLYTTIKCHLVQPVDLPGLTMWVDEEGILTGQPANIPATKLCASIQPVNQRFHGTAVFTGAPDHYGSTQGLTRDRTLSLTEHYLTALDAKVPSQRTR